MKVIGRSLESVLLAAAASAAALSGQGRLSVSGPDPAVVVFPQESRIGLRIAGEVVTAPRLPAVDGCELALQGPSRQSRTVFDGRRTTSATWTDYTVVVRPLREGEFTIPPIRLVTDAGPEQSPELRLRAVKDIEGAKYGFFEMTVEPERVYVHEPIRVRFDLGLDAGLKVSQHQARNGEPYLDIEVVAPWLAKLEGTVPIDGPAPPRGAVNLVHEGRLLPTTFVDGSERAGRPVLHFSFERSYLPSQVGTITVPGAVMGFEAETGRYRVVEDFFVRRRVPETKRYYVDAPPHTVEVLPLPEAGRPQRFYGAVGRFTMGATADRQRVKVGSSVKLSVVITGAGNTEFFEIPELPAVDGYHLLGTKEKRERGRVEAIYDLTPLRADAGNLPAVSWNFFDTTPGVERYVELATDPIALTIEPLPPGEALEAISGEATRPVIPGVDDIFDIKELGAGEPIASPELPGSGVTWAWLLAPWLLLAVATFAWRARARSLADVAGRRGRGARRRFRERLHRDGAFEALVGYVADRLDVAEAAVIGPALRARLQARGVGDALAAAVATAVEAGVAARYGGGGAVDAATAERLVAELEQTRLRPAKGVGAAPMLLLAALVAGGVRGQQAGQDLGVPADADPAARAEAAYRSGDYAAAADLYGDAARQRSDRRMFYNRGNALYREGRFAEALAAYERARLGMPRDRKLLANIALVRRKLELGTGEGEPFLDAVAALRDAFRPGERLVLGAGLHAAAALLLLLGWRRGIARALGFAALLPALLLTVELVWLQPSRPPRGIVLEASKVVAEPRDGLEPIFELRPGVTVAVLGEGPRWDKVRVGDREGYVDARLLAVVR